MKVRIATQELSKALQRANSVANKRQTQPQFSYAWVRPLSASEIEIFATDGDISLTGKYSAQVSEYTLEDSFTLHARQSSDLVRTITEPEVEITTLEAHSVELRSKHGVFKFLGIDMSAPQPLQKAPRDLEAPVFDVHAQALAQLIDRSVFCASTEEERQNLSGVYVEKIASNRMRFVATDGHRLSYADYSAQDGDIAIDSGRIIPRRSLLEMRKLLSDGDTHRTVRFGLTSQACMLVDGGLVFHSQLVQGVFPKYDMIIPKSPDKRIKMNRMQLADCLKRVSLVSQQHSYAVHMLFEPESLTLKAESPEFGTACEKMAIHYQGDPVQIVFNAKYILDVLALIPEQGILWEMIDAAAPAMIQPLEASHFLALVMPMNVND